MLEVLIVFDCSGCWRSDCRSTGIGCPATSRQLSWPDWLKSRHVRDLRMYNLASSISSHQLRI